MAETHTCTWSPAVGRATVTRNGNELSFQHTANPDLGAIASAPFDVRRTYNLADRNAPVKVQDLAFGRQRGEDRFETISRNDGFSIAYNRCVNDMKSRGGVPVDFLRAVRSIAHRY